MIFWNVLVKSCMAITAMILLSATTPFPNLLHALERLRVPRIFVMLASFAYRYLFVLVDEAERMERARDSRCYTGRWLWHAGVVGQTIGMLFLRSYERAERVYAAMVSRGFTGEALPLTPLRMRGTDAAFLIASVGFFGLLRVGGR
jgi:cobalt/nickel transport system permease protein